MARGSPVLITTADPSQRWPSITVRTSSSLVDLYQAAGGRATVSLPGSRTHFQLICFASHLAGSQDGSICLWSLEDWSLLNVIAVGQPVGHITLSTDDVFLMAVGLDDSLPRLYSLTTGSPLRTWTDLPIKVKNVFPLLFFSGTRTMSGKFFLLKVNGAVIVGGNGHSLAALTADDGRLMCYDCHGGHLVHSLSTNGGQTALCSRSNDPRLLFHAGNRGISRFV